MDYAFHLLELIVLGYLTWRSHTPPPAQPELRTFVQKALQEHLKTGGGRERLRARLAAKAQARQEKA